MSGFRNSLGVIVFALFIAVLSVPSSASAETEPPAFPAFGCNSAGCSIWVLDYAWPDSVSVNAFDFVRLNIEVNRTNANLSGSFQYLGLLCRIPLIAASSACPGSGDQAQFETQTIDASWRAVFGVDANLMSWEPITTPPRPNWHYIYRA